jgi:hypothetical protein
MWLITFDIDGTMEFGDPPGLLTRRHVEYFRTKGAIVGSASDRPESSQWMMWKQYGVELDFVILKHRMPELRERYPDLETYWHVGDRPLDQQTARVAGFTFFWPDQFPSPEMAAEFFGPDAMEEGVQEYDTLEDAALKLATHALNGKPTAERRLDHNPRGAGRLPGDLGGF